MEERREYDRTFVKEKMNCTVSNDEISREVHVIDYSQHGIRILYYDGSLPENIVLQLDSDELNLHRKVKVIWSRKVFKISLSGLEND
jgi:hypothetical protein